MNEPKKVEFPKIEADKDQVRRIAEGLVGSADGVWPEDFQASGGAKNVPGLTYDLFNG